MTSLSLLHQRLFFKLTQMKMTVHLKHLRLIYPLCCLLDICFNVTYVHSDSFLIATWYSAKHKVVVRDVAFHDIRVWVKALNMKRLNSMLLIDHVPSGFILCEWTIRCYYCGSTSSLPNFLLFLYLPPFHWLYQSLKNKRFSKPTIS